MNKIIFSLILSILLIPVYSFAIVKVYIPNGGMTYNDNKDSKNISVKLPFDEEYKIKLNNKDENRRALVKISIDGRSVTSDGLILRKGESIELERFLDNGNLSKGNKFKFIEKDSEVRKHRKDKEEDGLIIITAQYEKSKDPIIEYSDSYVITSESFFNGIHTSPVTLTSVHNTINTSTSYTNDQGITVEGSESHQRFQEEKIGDLEDRIDTLIIRLSGFYKVAPILLNK